MVKSVPDEMAFWFCNKEGFAGQISHSLEEFASHIKVVPIESLEFHLREDKNDFEAWLMNVMQKKRLARKMAKVKKMGLQGEELRNSLVTLVSTGP
jgi:alpha-amylase